MQAAKLNEEDFISQVFVASTHEYVLFLSSAGRAYWLKVHEIPEGARTAKGEHIKTLLQLAANEEIAGVVALTDKDFERYILMATANGTVKKTLASEFRNAKTRGVTAISLEEGDRLVSALLTSGEDEVVLISQSGKALRTGEDAIRAMGRTSRGVRGMKLLNGDELAAVLRVAPDESMFILTEYGYGKRAAFDSFSIHGRGTGGQRAYGVNERTGEIAAAVTVRDDEEVVALTSQGKSIKLKVKDVRVMGNSAAGVRILNIEKPDVVVGLDQIVKDEEE
jgi:DNA gyrase subunit A